MNRKKSEDGVRKNKISIRLTDKEVETLAELYNKAAGDKKMCRVDFYRSQLLQSNQIQVELRKTKNVLQKLLAELVHTNKSIEYFNDQDSKNELKNQLVKLMSTLDMLNEKIEGVVADGGNTTETFEAVAGEE